jgi:hypothetical protein
MQGQRFRDISRQVFQGDYDIISTLATFEHLSMISQMPASPSISVQVEKLRDLATETILYSNSLNIPPY